MPLVNSSPGSTPRISRSLSEPPGSWHHASTAKSQYLRRAPPPIQSGLPISLPHMATLLHGGPSTAVWPTQSALQTWKPSSDTTSSSYTTTSDESAQMDVEGDYMLNHQQTMQTRLRTPRAGFSDVPSMATSSAVASYERSLQNAYKYGYESSDSGSSSPSFIGAPVSTRATDVSVSSVHLRMQEDADMKEDARSPMSDGGLAEMLTSPTVEKTSRYLREIDRRVILSRIDSGEKQSVLAKEYQVSRAAICNLNKHRDEVFARKDGNPLAKHPKKPRPKTPKPTVAGMPSSMKWTSAGGNKYCYILGASGGSSLERSKFGVHEIKSRAAALLLTTLRRKYTPPVEFRRVSGRLMNLLMEEALALVPIRRVEIVLHNQRKEAGVAMEHPPCAISMEQEGCPMLELFHEMEPEQPTGYICFDLEAKSGLTDTSASDIDSLGLSLFDSHLPPSLSYHNVFLLDHVASSGARLSAAVRCLQERGVSKSMLYIVSLIASVGTVQELRAQHPDVKFISAQIVPDEEEDAVEDSMDDAENADPSNTSQTALMKLRLQQAYESLSC